MSLSKSSLYLEGCLESGSGKTTWAKDYIRDNPNTIRVNRDDIRFMLTPNFKHGSKMEEIVTIIELGAIRSSLGEGYSCIIDATNFRGTEHFARIAEDNKNDIEIEIRDFDTDLKTCIQRDQQRVNPVGKEVIERMYNKYIKVNKTESFSF